MTLVVSRAVVQIVITSGPLGNTPSPPRIELPRSINLLKSKVSDATVLSPDEPKDPSDDRY